ncbi:ATP-binding cassette, subfamily C, CydC [Nocardia amikacinitolerans]|uniref:ATP-binding cassette domain-containing protein n=1 Tax=Nocardia amikacinitolerans TaxID=756689 RepID=UPI00082A6655|nr:ATP-binding cassette domain-containing protein [Nocardia amikacinitolerans]MCP2317334.1 ATP-binding cassette, subfamily C, CydC [Nocardia amikacinitolerans]
MWSLLELSPWRVAVAVGWGVLALGSGLGLAALAAWLIARAWQMPPVLDLSVAVVSVRALGISRGLCRYLERLATHDVALRSMTTARTSVYRTLAGSDVWLRRARGTNAEPRSAARLRRGDLLVRIGSDIDDLGAVVVRALVPIVVAIVLAFAAIGLLATISVAAAVILAVALGVSGILAPWLSARAAREAETAVRADRAEFTAQALTVLDHAAELRVAGRLDAALAAAKKAGERAVAAEDKAASHTASAAAATPLAIGASVLGALLIGIAIYGPTGGAPGAMTPMALTILVLLPLSAFEAVGPLPAAAQAITTARAALRRLSAAEAADPRRESGVRELPELPAGRRIAVVGPSGAGKTTLLMSWAGLFDTPRPDTTFFAEDAHLFGTSVLENLRVARGDITEAEAEKALRAVGLGDWLDSLADGIRTELVGGAAAVSGGQRRRLLLARALLAPARVLLLDEPTEHLEAEDGADLLRALLDPASGLVDADRTVVVVTHQLPDGHRADAVVHVDASAQVTVEYRADSAPRENPLPTCRSFASFVSTREGGGSKNE